MKRLLVLGLALLPLSTLSANPCWAESKAVRVANIAGVMAGKAAFCGLDTDSFVAKYASEIHRLAKDHWDEQDATLQFITSFQVAQQIGPVTETCSEFSSSFH